MTNHDTVPTPPTQAEFLDAIERGAQWGWHDQRAVDGSIRVLTGPHAGVTLPADTSTQPQHLAPRNLHLSATEWLEVERSLRLRAEMTNAAITAQLRVGRKLDDPQQQADALHRDQLISLADRVRAHQAGEARTHG